MKIFELQTKHLFEQARLMKALMLAAFFVFALLFIFIAFMVVYVHFAPAKSDVIIIHFDFFRGIDLIGNIGMLYRTLGLACLIFLVNLMLAKAFFSREPFLAYAMGAGTLFFSVLLLAAFSVIISVNPIPSL